MRRSLFEELSEIPPEETPLLEKMHCVLWDGDSRGDTWSARARGCFMFAKGLTPTEAMLNALKLRDELGRKKTRKVIL